MAYKGREYLKNHLALKRTRVLLRYRYYDMKNGVKYLRTLIPSEFMWMAETLGWCGKAVDSLADRLSFREFKNDNFDLNTIFAMNNGDILPDSAILSALIGSCCFVYISEDEEGYPRLQVIDGSNATGDADPITGMLKEGYAVISRDKNNNVEMDAYFLPYRTEFYQQNRLVRVDTHDAPYPLLVPIIYRPDAMRPFGHSRISRACMNLMQGALRTLLRSEVSAEFYSFPQKYVTGLAQDAEEMDDMKAFMSSFLRLTKDDEGDAPKLGQFTQQSMSPYTEQLRTFASLFAGETGLTLDDLGFVTDNPSSADAIKASHENLRLAARKAQKCFSSGFLNVGYLAACVRDQYSYKRQQFYLSKAVWEPVFEPDAAMLSGIGDGISKINQAVPGYFGPDNLRDMTGIDPNT
ncbi:MAG: phage portal protein [Oscillospiraceae bacterium]|nr:phage portal protein [Oscillospiraceae bacterium]